MCQGTPTGSASLVCDDNVRKGSVTIHGLPLYANCRTPRAFNARSVTRRLRRKWINRLIEYRAGGGGRAAHLVTTGQSVGKLWPDRHLQRDGDRHRAVAISMESK